MNYISTQGNLRFTLQPEEELQLTKFLMNCAADAVFWMDRDMRFLYVNDSACGLVGYSRKELLSMAMDDVGPDFLVKVWSKYWRTLKQQGLLSFESLHQTKEGQSFLVEIAFTYLEYNGSEYGCILVRNITKRKHAPAANTARVATPQSIFPAYPQLTEVFHFIEVNYHKPITLNDVAQVAGYSRSYLTQLARRLTGKTVYRWIVERRMAEACSLLLETSQTVEQISKIVGYHDAAHFFHQFRQLYGTTPQAWRKSHQTQYVSRWGEPT